MVRRFEAQTVGEKPIAEGIAKAIASSVKTQTFILADISAVKTPQRRTPPQSRVRAIARSLSVKITFATLSVLHGVVKHAIFAGVYR